MTCVTFRSTSRARFPAGPKGPPLVGTGRSAPLAELVESGAAAEAVAVTGRAGQPDGTSLADYDFLHGSPPFAVKSRLDKSLGEPHVSKRLTPICLIHGGRTGASAKRS